MAISPETVFKSFQDAIQLKSPLNKIEMLVVNCVLHKAFEKLFIVKELLLGPEKSSPSGYSSPALRMKEREKFVPPAAQLPDSILRSQQIKWQTGFLLDLLEETIIELEFQGSHIYLEYTLCCENLKLYDNQMIKSESQHYNKRIDYLQDKINNYKQNNHITQQYLLESTGPCLDKAVVNVYAEEHLGTLYGCMREVTRTEKNFLKYKENEKAVQQLTEKLNYETEEENLIHKEINSHLALLLTELTNKVEYWTNKYNTEIDQLDIELLHMKSQKDEQTTALQTLLEEFSKKKEIMGALQAEDDEREREKVKKLLEHKSAEKIQRWWRNILFRRKLLNLKHYKGKSSKNSVKKQRSIKKSKKYDLHIFIKKLTMNFFIS